MRRKNVNVKLDVSSGSFSRGRILRHNCASSFFLFLHRVNYPRNLFSSSWRSMRRAKLQIVKRFARTCPFSSSRAAEGRESNAPRLVPAIRYARERRVVARLRSAYHVLRERAYTSLARALSISFSLSLEGGRHDQIWCGLALPLHGHLLRRKFGVFNPPHVRDGARPHGVHPTGMLTAASNIRRPDVFLFPAICRGRINNAERCTRTIDDFIYPRRAKKR